MKKILIIFILLFPFFSTHAVEETGSGVIVNNYITNEGINKSVFDEYTLVELAKIQAFFMVVILMGRFFYRLITPHSRPANPFK